MNIVVCYKIVADEQDAVVKSDRTLSFERAALKIGDYDLNAVEAGATLANELGANLISLTAGDKVIDATKQRKSILSRGPNENVAVKDETLVDAGSSYTARVLAEEIRRIGDVGLVLCGEGSADRYSRQVGIQLGQMLDLPTINGVCAIEINGNTASIQRSVGNTIEKLDVELPAVLSVAADINTPRIPSMKEILGAVKKKTTIQTLEDIGTQGINDAVQVVSTLAPEQKSRDKVILDGSDEDTVKEFLTILKKHL
ncbi:MAG: putative electron transfer flavoprotein FixA [Eggerthellaceae bacterium]|nr:putative electron transfer flavoprotein FixA [Eggerthellaceae bacterium]